jgi:hypothetical protein
MVISDSTRKAHDKAVRVAEYMTACENAIYAAGHNANTESVISGWFHFHHAGPLSKQYRYDVQPCWKMNTFKDWDTEDASTNIADLYEYEYGETLAEHEACTA